jgi:hypothetical protein
VYVIIILCMIMVMISITWLAVAVAVAELWYCWDSIVIASSLVSLIEVHGIVFIYCGSIVVALW